jgi:hypothetical protein
MRCEEVRELIAIEADDYLAQGEVSSLTEHLSACPLCRQERDDIRNLTRDLRMMQRPAMPRTTLAALRAAVAERTGVAGFWMSEDRRPWLEAWLMPSSVGTFASVVCGIGFIWLLSMSQVQMPQSFAENVAGSRDPSQRAYAEQRVDVAVESPSINPHGALVALTNSLVRGEMKDDEVVVVAEVFGNGLAKIDEVVEPSRNRRAVTELEKALDSDPSFAPFVPAEVDKRPESVKVIFKIQSVNVNTGVHSKQL